MSVQIIRGNALDLPIEDSSVDLVVTSPPYFGLRSYQDGGEHYDGQIGAEATPAEFVDALIAATAEMVRVLKPSGSIWVNLGDRYSGASGGASGLTALGERLGTGGGQKQDSARTARPAAAGFRPKTLIGVPWRYALRCIDDLGLILRAEVIWSKPNGLPESVTDRVRRSHETWFHLTKEPRYYSAVDEVRETYSERVQDRQKYAGRDIPKGKWSVESGRGDGNGERGILGFGHQGANPLGKLPGSVWTTTESVSEGSDLIRSILGAVAAGALTVEEGERLWTGSSTSWGTSSSPTTAGTGLATDSRTATARSASSAPAARTTHTGSPTSCSSDPSPQDSPSTTSAATPPASDPTTSRRSPSARTSGEPTPSAPTVATDTPSTTPTPTSPRPGSPTRSAGPAPSPGSDEGESVWVVPTQPLRVPPELGVDHFAAFPMELVRRIIRGWSPAGVCTACGEGRRPNRGRACESCGAFIPNQGKRCADCGHVRDWKAGRVAEAGMGATDWSTAGHGTPRHPGGHKDSSVVDGYTCACPDTDAPTTPAVVIDPFGGTGTTALVAHALGRHGISVDMSADYCRLAEWRTTDPGQLAAAMQVEKPDVVSPDQDSLLDLLDGAAS